MAATNGKKKAWLKTADGWRECFLLSETSRLRQLELVGGEDDGQVVNIFGDAASHGRFYPALHVGDAPPDAFEYGGRWLPTHKDDDWDPELRKLIPDHEQYVFLPHTKEFLTGVIDGGHTLLYGDAGAGKTSIVEQVANRIRMPVIRINLTEHTMVSHVVGSMGIKNQETVFNDGPAIRAMRKGCWLLVDEGNFMPPPVQSVFFSIAEGKSTYPLKENDGEVVVAHPNFRLFVTANNLDGSEKYVGTQPFNRALLDRFSGHGQIIHTKSMSPAQERNVLGARVPALPESLVKRVVKCAHKIRQQGFMLTPRQVLNWARSMMIYRDACHAAEMTWLNVLASEVETDPKRISLMAMVKAEFGRRIRLVSRTVTPTGEAVAPRIDDEMEAQDGTPDEVVSEGVSVNEEDAEERLLERSRSGKRLQSSQVTDEVELRVIWKNYRGNGGKYSYVELENKFGLKNHNGNSARRCVKKYEEIMAEHGESLSEDVS